jgi:hypothetical protein
VTLDRSALIGEAPKNHTCGHTYADCVRSEATIQMKKQVTNSFVNPARVFAEVLHDTTNEARPSLVAKEKSTLKVLRAKRRLNRPQEPKHLEDFELPGIFYDIKFNRNIYKIIIFASLFDLKICFM